MNNSVIDQIKKYIDTIMEKLSQSEEKFDYMSAEAKLYIQQKLETVKKLYHEAVARFSDDEKDKVVHSFKQLEASMKEKGYENIREYLEQDRK